MIRNTWILSVVFGFGLSLQASADVCGSFSKGKEYSGNSRSELLQTCKGDPHSSNSDCDKYAVCDSDPGLRNLAFGISFTCTTGSNGFTFPMTHHFEMIARAKAIYSCQQNPRISYFDCESNLDRCDANYPNYGGGRPGFNPPAQPIVVNVPAEIGIASVAVNGYPVTSDQNGGVVNVRPGDVVSLTAELYNPAAGYAPMGFAPEAFFWQSDLGQYDFCDMSNFDDCSNSNFRKTATGILFRVPSGIGANFRINVTSHYPGAIDSDGYSDDDGIEFNNIAFTPPWNYVAPPRVGWQFYHSIPGRKIRPNGDPNQGWDRPRQGGGPRWWRGQGQGQGRWQGQQWQGPGPGQGQRDRDHDGTPDWRDPNPNTPNNPQRDRDNDGTPDWRDRNPNTPNWNRGRGGEGRDQGRGPNPGRDNNWGRNDGRGQNQPSGPAPSQQQPSQQQPAPQQPTPQQPAPQQPAPVTPTPQVPNGNSGQGQGRPGWQGGDRNNQGREDQGRTDNRGPGSTGGTDIRGRGPGSQSKPSDPAPTQPAPQPAQQPVPQQAPVQKPADKPAPQSAPQQPAPVQKPADPKPADKPVDKPVEKPATTPAPATAPQQPAPTTAPAPQQPAPAPASGGSTAAKPGSNAGAQPSQGAGTPTPTSPMPSRTRDSAPPERRK
ncbi:hypothetical protein K2X30_02425 [bacterium]|nr:hypothetical protein [bacterium]